MAQTVQLNQRVGGTNFFNMDGLSYLLVEFSWRPSTPTRESAKGQDGVHGYVEKPDVGRMRGKLRDWAGNSVTLIGQTSNSQCVASLANGKNIVGIGMWITELGDVSGEDGSVDVTFEGPSVAEA
jgi:hypothetical protein